MVKSICKGKESERNVMMAVLLTLLATSRVWRYNMVPRYLII